MQATTTPSAAIWWTSIRSPSTTAASVMVSAGQGVVIEDDVFGLSTPDRPPPIATMAPERTVYLSSLSKCVAPGLRVGFARAPRELASALRRAVNLTAWMTPPLTSELAARMIESGAAETLIAAQRRFAAERQRLAAEILRGRDIVADPHGLHAWLRLSPGWRSDAFRAAAERLGVLVADAREFAASAEASPDCVRICLSHEADVARLRHGLTQLDRLLDLPPHGGPLAP